MTLIDSHAHLTSSSFKPEELSTLVAAAAAAAVDRIIVINSHNTLDDLRATTELAGRFSALRAAIGYHPHEASLIDRAAMDLLRVVLSGPKIVALGEIGLDYHYTLSPVEVQRRVFGEQIDLAAEFDLPLVIHSRKADQDILAGLRLTRRNPPGVMHCFSGDLTMARSCLDLGWYLSFSGVITFKNEGGMGEVLRYVPLDRILVETDCPYLTPVPYRGKRNEPAYVRFTAEKLAQIKAVPGYRFGEISTANANKLFALDR